MRLLGLLLCLTAAAYAGESVVLTTGWRMHVDRHEAEGDRIRLYNGEGFIEMAASLVRGYEADETVPKPAVTTPAPAAPAPVTPAAPAPNPVQLADAAADKYGVPRWLVRSIMSAESAFQPRAVSPKGAIGLMQLMPGTAQDLGVDPRDPAQNVDAGARYIRDLMVRYNGKLWHVAAAYNAGPGAVDKAKTGVPSYRETIRYVKRIDQAYRKAAAEADPAGTR